VILVVELRKVNIKTKESIILASKNEILHYVPFYGTPFRMTNSVL
jgi:hypothetical protein